MNGREREKSHLSLLFVLLGVCKLDHYRGGAPLHRDAVVHRLDRNHRNLIKSIVSVLFLIFSNDSLGWNYLSAGKGDKSTP